LYDSEGCFDHEESQFNEYDPSTDTLTGPLKFIDELETELKLGAPGPLAASK